MIRWWPATCYCVVDCPRPSVNGKFINRCKIHRNSLLTTEVNDFGLANRLKSNEIDQNKFATEAGLVRLASLKLTTKP